jgi:putative oxidoreductase
MTSLVLFLLRATVGGLLVGHGGQKLVGWFGGHGLEGTAGWLASMRLDPPRRWAILAGGSELGGGVLTLLGFLNPLGPIAAIAAMATAWTKVHLGKPIWVSTGGAELPLVNIAVLSALAMRGPGKLSIDYLSRIRVPRWLALGALMGAIGGVALASRAEIEERLTPAGDDAPSSSDDVAAEAADALETDAGSTLAADVAGDAVDDADPILVGTRVEGL